MSETTRDGPARAPADLLDGLTASQRRAVTSPAMPLCVLAGAGAGKTRVLTRRIAYRVQSGTAQASHVLALTFTKKASGELEQRLRHLGLRDRVVAGTFHSVAAAQLRRWWADRGQKPPALLDRKARLLGPLAAERPALAGVPVADLASQIEWAKARLVSADAFAEAGAGRDLPAPASDIASLYGRYEHEKRRRNVVDFDDLLARVADAIDADPLFAAAQRWRWRHVFVDEFQDLNPLQHRLLLAWLGAGADLCAVGDPNQAIYGWNGADPSLLAGLPDRWPEAEVVRLDDNHRSSPQVLAAATAVLGPAGADLRSRRPDGPPPTVRRYPSEVAEARAVATQVHQARASGLGWGQMAILVRTNAQAEPLRRALGEADVPCRALAGSRLLDEPAVRRALSDLRGRSALPFAMWVADLERAARGDDPAAADDDPGASLALAGLARLAREYAELDRDPSGAAFASWLPAAAEDAPGARGPAEAVVVASFHRAKGLEWPAVWVCGLEQGLVPFGRRSTPSAEAEERRLLYVALTRAERQLSCSWAATRAFGGHSVPREPSPWLAAITATTGAGSAGASEAPVVDAAAWRARLRQQRAHLAIGPRPAGARSRRPPSQLASPDPEILESLRAWRAQRARAAGVPAHVVLHDRTLAALATLRPSSAEELLEVPGVGSVQVARFGASLLAVLAAPVPA